MRIFVGNLNARTTAQHLTNLFLQFGRVLSVRIIGAGFAGQSGGIGYVEMESKSGFIAIRELDGVNFMNHYLEIDEDGVSLRQ